MSDNGLRRVIAEVKRAPHAVFVYASPTQVFVGMSADGESVVQVGRYDPHLPTFSVEQLRQDIHHVRWAMIQGTDP